MTKKLELQVRQATSGDIDAMAALSTQLGYPSTSDQVRDRFAHIHKRPDHAVLVAQLPDNQVIGFVHVSAAYWVESDPEAEIGGLAVDEAYRGAGTGRLLMEAAEQWARAKELRSVYLRSNIIRNDAHAFYKKLGYGLIKTQYAFRKLL